MIVRKGVATRIPVRLLDSTGAAVTGMLPVNVGNTNKATLIKSDGTIVDFTLTNGSNWFEVSSTKAPGLYHVQVALGDLDTIGPTQLSVIPAATAFVTSVSSFLTEDFAAKFGTPAGASVSADIAAVKSDTAAINAKTTNLPASPAAVSDVTAARDSIKGAGPNDITQVYTRVGAPAGASVSADVAAVKTDTAAINAKTTNLPADPASNTAITAAQTSIKGASNKDNTQLDTKLGTPVTSVSADIAAVSALATVVKKIQNNRWKIVGTQLVIYDDDGLTPYRTFNLLDNTGAPSNTRIFERAP